MESGATRLEDVRSKNTTSSITNFTSTNY